MARRDVQRLEPAEVGAERWSQLAREGKQIVRLITAPVDPALVQALAAGLGGGRGADGRPGRPGSRI
jgi:hypothetical protein